MKKQIRQNNGTTSLPIIFTTLVLAFCILAIIGIAIWDRHMIIHEIGTLIRGPEIIPILILSGIAIIFILTFDKIFGYIITTFTQIIQSISRNNNPSQVPINVQRSRSTKQNRST